MAKNGSIANELKALGLEMAGALKEMSASKEFKDLEHEIASSVKKISANLISSLDAARKSDSAGKIKNRVGRLAKMGASKGAEKAVKAQKKAADKLHKMNKAFRKLAKKIGK